MKPSEDASCPGRRSFCCLACAAVALALLPSALEAGAAPESDPRRVTGATRASFTPGTIQDYRKPDGFFLIADAAGIYAVSAICTHLGCKVALADNQGFDCPCHDSEYDLQGNVLQGPARLPLAHFEVTEQAPGGPLVVDLSRKVDAHARF